MRKATVRTSSNPSDAGSDVVTGPKRVLFLCIGNACRSQMAEAFARAYGSDVLTPASAGLTPAHRVPSDTIRAMEEKNLDLRAQEPKSLSGLGTEFDLIINMSGFPLPQVNGGRLREWDVPDPIGMDYTYHCQVRDQIETLVRELILELRHAQK
jgi:arsenate reductase (thioredoxin)